MDRTTQKTNSTRKCHPENSQMLPSTTIQTQPVALNSTTPQQHAQSSTTRDPNITTQQRNSNTLKFIQINLHSSRLATAQLGGLLASEKYNIALIQDFYLDYKNDRVSAISNRFNAIKTPGNKAAILANTGLVPTVQLVTDYTVAISLEHENNTLTIINTYPPPHQLIST